MDDERARKIEDLLARLDERDKQREKDLASMSQRLWAIAAAVLIYVGNQIMALIGTSP